ncbi:uncharacterized protein LOC128246600 isoform X3 [Mya arenaria]|nr:uncharacterized protein LOC128246600 isoform X3 [Mya arenaria]
MGTSREKETANGGHKVREKTPPKGGNFECKLKLGELIKAKSKHLKMSPVQMVEEQEEEGSIGESEDSEDIGRLVVNESEKDHETDEVQSEGGENKVCDIPTPQYVLNDIPIKTSEDDGNESPAPNPQFLINQTLPLVSELNEDPISNDSSVFEKSSESPLAIDLSKSPEVPPILQVKPPYKGTMVPCGQLKEYLDSLPTFNRKCMLRKGREVHKIYVDMTKGETFLDDQFAYTEFGRMVLTNGSIRAGRAKNAKQIVVARETLYCSGTTACKRACGGYGLCLPGCDKTKMRGHRCSYRIKLTQRLGFVNFWFVEELGSHDQLNGKDCDFKVNSQHASMVSDSKLTDFTSSFKVKLPTIPKSPRKLAPKPFKKLTAEKGQGNGKMDPARPDSNTDATTYNYVLGSIPNSESAEELTSAVSSQQSSNFSNDASLAISMNITPSQFPCATDMNTNNAMLSASLQAAGQTLPSMLQPVPSLTPAMSSMLQANLINYMTSMTNLGIPVSNASNLPNGAINPFLVNIKQEPSSHDLQSQNVLAFSQAFPLIAPPLQFSPQGPNPGHSSLRSPSPSQSSSQGHKERSPLARDQNANIQKSLDIEAKIKREASGRVQANHETLGQVQNRIMERAKSRKSAHTMRVPQRNETNVIDLSKSVNDIKQENFSVTKEGLCGKRSIDDLIDRKVMSSQTFKRLQTLNHVIQSDVFQKAKNRLEKNNVANLKSGSEEIALNLTTRNSQFSKFDSDQQTDTQQSYFKLAEAWKEGRQLDLPHELTNGQEPDLQEPMELSPLSAQYGSTNGNKENERLDMVNGLCNSAITGITDATSSLTNNEKELMSRIRQLETHVKVLQRAVKEENSVAPPMPRMAMKRKKKFRPIDFNKYTMRHVALKIMYLGHDYTGYAGTEEAEHTIERELFEALIKCKLIESKESACYSRCGRTDKGVSAFGQVVSLDVRSNLLSGVGVKVREGMTAHERPGDKTTEIRYCHVLNRNLPRDIRVLAWAPIDPDFSARFSCRRRTYKYFFPKGDLNILLMEEAGKKLIGEYDFRNFCKFNVKDGITNYVRKIMEVEVKTLDETDDGFTMCELTIVGRAFLWHQIRSIFSVLFLVGKGKESVEVVDELLNIEKNPRKPQYNMSSDAPLCLYDADFGGEFEWIYEAECHEDNLTSLQQLWAEHSIKATMVKSMLNDLEKAKVETDCDIAPWCDLSPPLLMQSEWLVEDRNPKVLMERQGGLTLDEMIASHESRKQRWRENAEIEAQDDSSEEEMTSRKRQRLEIDKPSHIDDKPFGTLDKPKSGENKDPHIIYGENNKGDDDTVRDIDGETTNMKADKDICNSKTSLKDNGEENLETSENGMKGEEKVGRSTQEEIGESSVISQTGE